MRLFTALDIPQELRQKITKRMYGWGKEVKWVPEQQIHLTLQFLAEHQEAELPSIIQALQSIQWNKFHLVLEDSGFFPNAHQPHIFWAGILWNDGAEQLQKLKLTADETLKKIHIRPESRRFIPHISLAKLSPRFRICMAPVLQKHFRDFLDEPFEIDHFTLYQSVLNGHQTLHIPIQSFTAI